MSFTASRVPALIAPGVGDGGGPFEYDELPAFLFQVVADGETCLTTTHDNGINLCDIRTSLHTNPMEENERQRASADDDPKSESLEKWAKTDPPQRLLVQSCADQEQSHG